MLRDHYGTAQELMEAMADASESGRSRISFKIDHGKFDSARQADAFEKSILAHITSDILIGHYDGKGFSRRLARVTLKDRERLFSSLGRTALKNVIADTLAKLDDGHEAWELGSIATIKEAWLSRKRWQRLGPEDIGVVEAIQVLARAIKSGEWQGHDHRTLCSRLVGDSKFIENRAAALFAYAFHGEEKPADTTRGIIEALGLQKGGQPVLISGPFGKGDFQVGEHFEYLGIAENDLLQIKVARRPEYVLTIENQVSFNRHVAEINEAKDGLIIFTGGQPSHNVQTLYTHLLSQIDEEVPVFHWSDIDLGGLEIFSTVNRLCSRVKPHLMTAEILLKSGKTPPTPQSIPLKTWPEQVKAIAEAMQDVEARTLEQEVLDPKHPCK
jgi:hypothetical protein